MYEKGVVLVLHFGLVAGSPDRKLKNQNFFQNQKTIRIFLAKSEINQKGQFLKKVVVIMVSCWYKMLY
jgi:hypothetical protein